VYRKQGITGGRPFRRASLAGRAISDQIVVLTMEERLLSTPAELTDVTAKYHVPELNSLIT
jgi:hypothetical protein